MVYKSYNSIFLKNKNLFLYSTISLVAENAKKKRRVNTFVNIFILIQLQIGFGDQNISQLSTPLL